MELQRAHIQGLELIKDHPTAVNAMLREEEVLTAPSSSINLLLGSNIDMSLQLGVACDGPVDSVYIGLKKRNPSLEAFIEQRTSELAQIYSKAENLMGHDLRVMGESLWKDTMPPDHAPSQIPGIKFSSRSASGATISKMFYGLTFGRDSLDEALSITHYCEEDSVFELVIGDIALKKKCQYEYIIDLGQWWKDITGLPFVYAVWQKGSRSVPGKLKKVIYEAASLAQAKMQIDPTEYLLSEPPVDKNGSPISLPKYWKNIRYRLGAQDFKALGLFLAIGRHVLNCQLEESFILKMNRWDQIRQGSLTL